MTDPEYAAHCDCGAFGVSTDGTNWSQGALVSLVRSHLKNCPADETAIDIVERRAGGEEHNRTVERRGPTTEARSR